MKVTIFRPPPPPPPTKQFDPSVTFRSTVAGLESPARCGGLGHKFVDVPAAPRRAGAPAQAPTVGGACPRGTRPYLSRRSRS